MGKELETGPDSQDPYDEARNNWREALHDWNWWHEMEGKGYISLSDRFRQELTDAVIAGRDEVHRLREIGEVAIAVRQS